MSGGGGGGVSGTKEWVDCGFSSDRVLFTVSYPGYFAMCSFFSLYCNRVCACA